MINTIWGADYADPSTFLDLYTSDSSFNHGSWKNAEYDNMKAAKTTDVNDDEKRYADYAKAEKIPRRCRNCAYFLPSKAITIKY